MAKTTRDPFTELRDCSRRITPKTLRGKKKIIWDQFVKDYRADKYIGLSMRQLHDWAKKHCGLTCSASCMRQTLINQAPN